MEPEQVKVIVLFARNLQGKKKGRCKASVIFGFGNQTYRTEVINDPTGNPIWNEEASFDITDLYTPLTFVVTEKEYTLGQVEVTVSSISRHGQHKSRTVPLQPHKKNSKPKGELTFECSVTKYRKVNHLTTSSDTNQVASSPKSQHLGNRIKETLLSPSSPFLRRFVSKENLNTKSNNCLVPLDGRESRSYNDISRLGLEKQSPNFQGLTRTSSNPSMKTGNILTDTDSDEASLRPEVTGISPKEGLVSGNTKLTIRGKNLGNNVYDVIGLSICGANCLAMLEYESSTKLYTYTKPWKPCKGDVIVTTQSGGRGISSVQFTFYEAKDENLNNTPPVIIVDSETEKETKRSFLTKLLNTDDRKLSGEKKSHLNKELSMSKEELLAEVKKLKKQVLALTEQNKDMKIYIDNLVLRVMEECPEALSQPQDTDK